MTGLQVLDGKQLPAPLWVRLAARLIPCLPAGRYRVMNWLCCRPMPTFLMRLPGESGGYRFTCDLQDAIAREVCFTGRYEPQETALVQALLQPGMTFADVGANWGYFTLLAAHLVDPGGRVISLEPDPRLFKLLSDNIRRNALCHVTALPIAAADRSGEVTLAGYDERGGNSGVSRIVNDTASIHRPFVVLAQTLDTLLDQFNRSAIDLLKMDIEGAEGLALTGLSRSLAEQRVKRLLVELHPAQLAEHGHSCASVIDRLRECGYSVWAVDHSRGQSRRAAYKAGLNPRTLLRPINPDALLDEWPHVLCAAPGLEPIP